MFRRIVMTALAAGVLAGIFGWGLQMVTTTPLIMAAEMYEPGGGEAAMSDAHTHDSAAEETDGHEHDHGDGMWMPEGGMERHAYTLLTSIPMGVGFGFVLTGVFALCGRGVGLNEGVLWGLGGFAAIYLAPALGLPPELPGMMASDLDARQMWWIFAVAGSSVGLALIVFSPNPLWKLAGALITVIPHIVGAPQPEMVDLAEMAGSVPAEMAARFAVTSLVTVGLFWVVLGALAGYFYDRFSEA